MSACAGPGAVLDLADASTGAARRDGADAAADILADRGERLGRRVAAAITLGRLQISDEGPLSSLAVGLRPDSPAPLRDASAWALGELRSEASLPLILAGLQSRPGRALGRRLLQSVAQHHAVLAGRPELAVRVVDAMTHFSGNLQGGAPPPSYDLVGARTRNLEVDVQVIANAISAHRARPTAVTAAALYAAAFELLARLDGLRSELSAAGARTRASESIAAAAEAGRLGGPRTARLVTWFLGELASEPLYAPASGRALVALAERAKGPGDRLVVAWALAQAQLDSLPARRGLGAIVWGGETEEDVLESLGGVTGDAAEDILQRVLGVRVRSE